MLLAPLVLAQELPEAPEFASVAALREEFRRACSAGDEERCRELIPSHEFALLSSFDELVQSWLERQVQLGDEHASEPIELEGIARAALAKTGSGEWLVLLERLRGFNAAERELWLEGRLAYGEGASSGDPRKLERALDAFERLGWEPGIAWALLQLKGTWLERGELARGREQCERAADLGRRLGWPLVEFLAGHNKIDFLIREGRLEEVDAGVEHTLEHARRVGRKRYLHALSIESERQRSIGRLDRARELAARGLREAMRRGREGDPPSAARSAGLLMELAFAEQDELEAIEWFTQACEVPHDQMSTALARRDRLEVRSLIGAGPHLYLHSFNCHALRLAWHRYSGEATEELAARTVLLAQELGPPALLEQIERLAAGNPTEALEFLRGWVRAAYGGHLHRSKKCRDAVPWISAGLDSLPPGGWPTFRVQCSVDLANCLRELGRMQECLQPLKEACSLSWSMPGPEGWEAYTRTLLGDTLMALGNYPQAIIEFEQARERVRSVGRAGDRLALGSEADAYLALGQDEKALSLLLEALELRNEWQLHEGTLLRQLGVALSSLGRLDEALRYFEASRESRTGSSGAELMSPLSISLLHLGRTEEALEAGRRALADAERRQSPALIHRACGALGRILFATGDVEGALRQHERALQLQEDLGHHRDAAFTALQLASDHRALGQAELALASLEGCLAHIDQVGRRFLPEEGRNLFLAQWADVPALASQLVAQLAEGGGEAVAARGLALVDAFQASTLLEGLQERSDAVLQVTNVELFQARERSLDELMSLRVELAGDRSESEHAELAARLREKQAECDQAEQRLRLANPALAELAHPEGASLAALRGETLGPADALLQYVLGEEASFLWVITRERLRVVRLESRAILGAEHDRLAEALDPSGALGASFLSPARRLYELLLAPVEDEIARKTRLIVVPDGFLAFVPFDALLTKAVDPTRGQLPFLIRERVVVYAPSSSFYGHGAERSARSGKDILLVGDPNYPAEPLQEAALAMRPLAALDPRRVQRLSKTRDEVLGIAGDFLAPDESALRERLRAFPRNGELQGRRFDLLLGAEATKSRVLARSGGHRILHLAVHGYVDPEYPWFSGLALGGEGGEPCSFLSVVEIASMELDAELVFLSACETALGSILRAEGIKNTARAFLLAGAREVVATQWTVGDEASARLAQSFYRGYAAGEPAAEALRRAKLELIDARVVTANTVERGIGAVAPDRTPNELAHPAFWAPYVLWGRATR